MKQIWLSILLLLSLLLGTTHNIYAQRVGRWEKIGQRSVNLSLDKDVIYCSHKGSFRTIKFHVEKAPVSFIRVYVKYMNGTVDNLRFSQLVRPGRDSGELDLRGGKRIIKEIVLYYKTEKKQPRGHKHSRREAMVQVWGKH